MRCIKYWCVVIVLLASCRATRPVAAVADEQNENVTIAVVVSPGHKPAPVALPEIDTALAAAVATPVDELPMKTEDEVTSAAQPKKHITSFAQMKQMARNGEIAMSKKDLKTLNRLEKHYKGNYEQFRADTFELTDKAKIIGGIGILGLLIGVIFGSAFGWFLFVVAALAFLLRYLNIIAF